MLKLAEHIVETKTGDFDPSEFVDHYETAVVDLLKQKQADKVIPKQSRTAAPQAGNVIDLLKRSLEMEGKKVKAPQACPGHAKIQEDSGLEMKDQITAKGRKSDCVCWLTHDALRDIIPTEASQVRIAR